MRTDYRSISLKPRERLLFAGVLALALTAAGILFYDVYWFGAFALPALIPGQRIYAEHLAEKRRKRLREEFKDVLYSYSASLAAGRNITEAGSEAVRTLESLYGSSSVMAGELRRISAGITMTAMGETEGWMDLAERSGIEDIRDFASVFAACRTSGANSIRAVDRAARIIGEKMTAENEIRSITSQKKTEGRMIGAMPLVMLAFMRLSSPGYLAPMYCTAAGRVIMTAALAAIAWSVWMAEKLCRIEV